MVRLFILLVNLVVIAFMEMLVGNGVSVNVSAPEKVEAGTEFTVQVTINKGDINSFSRYTAELPEGITAYPDYSANAVDFSFEDNKIRVIWLKLPEEEEFSFSYKIRVDKRLKGNLNLGGKFAYIDENERKISEATADLVAVQPNPDIDPSLVVDISEFGKFTIPRIDNQKSADILCVRQDPSLATFEDEIMIHLLVNKKQLQQFAKIEENIPEGFIAMEVESQNGIFTYKEGVAKIIWRNLPTSDFFRVSYKLIPRNGKPSPDVDIRGEFSYYENEVTHTLDIIQRSANIAGMDDAEMQELIADLSTPGKKEVPEKKVPEVQPTEQKDLIAREEIQDEADKAPEAPDAKEKKVDSKPAKSYRSDLLQPQSGVYYRVQVAAGHRPVNVDRYFKRLKLNSEVKKEKHEGWLKYSVGSFSTYKDARDHRVHIWNTTRIDDAFVSAYNRGNRITVQEALMITHQEWYR